MEEDSIKNEDKDEDEKSIWYYLKIFGVILVIAIMYILTETYASNKFLYAVLTILIIVFMVISPLIEIIDKRKKNQVLNTIDISRFFIFASIALLSVYTIYKIINFTIEDWNKNHVLYQFTIMCVIVLLILSTIKEFVKSLKDIPELEKTPFRYMCKTLVFVLSFTVMFVIPFCGIYEQKENVTLNNMKIPSLLEVYVINEPLSETNWRSYRKKVTTIEDEKIINSLMSEIEGSNISNIRLFERLGYELIEDESLPYYEIDLMYESTNGCAYFKTLQEGYIGKIKIYKSGHVIAEIANLDFKVFKKTYLKKYKLPVSQSDINQIIKVAKQ